MSGQDQVRRDVAYLLRRAGFGGRAEEVDALAGLGYERAVDEVCRLDAPDPSADAVPAPSFDTAGYLDARAGDAAARRRAADQVRDERRALVLWWIRRMVAAERPLREKLTFLWHDHFATSLAKVQLPELMHRQWATLHELGAGRFDDLVHAVARDPAMLIWLDGRESRAGAPNENFARELLELFTLGHGSAGHHGTSPYTERDVSEAARALTGWVIDPRSGTGRLVPNRRDAGSKSVLGVTGELGLDEVVAAATQHPACAPHVVAALWSRLARPAGVDDPAVRELATSFARDLDVASLLRAIFLHPDFRAPQARTALVKTPVELVVGMARALRLDPDERVLAVLAGLGQVPFAPPDVDGWPGNEGWLSTSSALIRLQVASAMAGLADRSPIVRVSPAERPAAAARLLGVEAWSESTDAALADVAVDPQRLLTLALAAPDSMLA
jgi:uncharacterized protein (DUF1800 family)